jgi:O-methyltransferase
MKRTIIKINAFLKGVVFFLKPHLVLGWVRQPLLTISNTISLTKWISSQERKTILNDFYNPKRDYSKRYELYQYVSDKLNLKNEGIIYLEFGVCGGHSFKWWLNNCISIESRFYGFDTFEGLPEKWGTFSKGDMAAGIPDFSDNRATFVKGLFQESVPVFLKEYDLATVTRRIVHLDADLFSSTLYALTSIAPYLRKGDILIFDEFNVPNHEFFAFKLFSDSYYIKTKLLGAVNNYFQVAMIID